MGSYDGAVHGCVLALSLFLFVSLSTGSSQACTPSSPALLFFACLSRAWHYFFSPFRFTLKPGAPLSLPTLFSTAKAMCSATLGS